MIHAGSHTPFLEGIGRAKIFAGLKSTVPTEVAIQGLEGRLPKWGEAFNQATQEYLGRESNWSKLPTKRQRWLASIAENIKAHHEHASAIGAWDSVLAGDENARRKLKLKDDVTTSDVATYTTQQLAMVDDVFASWLIPEVVDVTTMTGPTAFVHRQILQRGSASTNYSVDADLTAGFDPDYSDCPTECDAANLIDVEYTSELVEADCLRLAGKYCIPANWHVSSQYNRDLGGVINSGIFTELQRAVTGKVLSSLRASAAATYTWNRTPTVGSYFASANPREWKQELWNTVRDASRDTQLAADGRVQLDKIIGDVEGVGVLEEAMPIELASNGMIQGLVGQGDEKFTFQGTTRQGVFKVFKFLEGLGTDELILTAPGAAIYAPWIPITALQALTNPTNASVELGAITLFGFKVLRTGRVRLVAIGA